MPLSSSHTVLGDGALPMKVAMETVFERDNILIDIFYMVLITKCQTRLSDKHTILLFPSFPLIHLYTLFVSKKKKVR